MTEPVTNPSICPVCGENLPAPVEAGGSPICPRCQSTVRDRSMADTAVLQAITLSPDSEPIPMSNNGSATMAPPPLAEHIPPPPPLPEPRPVYAPRAMPEVVTAPAPAPGSLFTPPLRVAEFDGPDREDQIVPMLLDRSASEPGWPGSYRPPSAPVSLVAPLAPTAEAPPIPAAEPIEIAPLPLPADLVSASPITPPVAPAAINPSPAADEPGGPTADDVRAVFAARAAANNRSAAPPRRGPHPIWWALAGVAVSVVVVFGVLVGTHQVDWFDSWEAQAAPQVRQLKLDAEALAARGNLKESHEKYRQIEALIGGREIHEPSLQRSVDEARQDARRIYNTLLAQAAPPPRPAVVVSPPLALTNVNPNPAPASTQTVAVNPPVPLPATTPSTDNTSATAAPPATNPTTATTENPPVAAGPPLLHARPAPRPMPAAVNGVTDEQIGQSIQDGVNYLLQQFDRKNHTLRGKEMGDDSYFAGMDSLAVYALLQAGQAIADPRLNYHGEEMRQKIDAMKAIPMTGQHLTYARALRATCLALFDRPEDFKNLNADVDYLVGSTEAGAYTYAGQYKPVAQRGNFTVARGGGFGWDNSNSQYGVLGVWSGVEAEPRIEVPLAYWKAVEHHWSSNQNSNGEWGYGYGGTGGRLSMTCAGIASLFVAHEYIEPPLTSGTVGREPFPPSLKKALAWFEDGNNSVSLRNGNWWGYALYGIERVGLASGFKHFGRHDWYRELAEQAVRRQLQNGSWGDGVVDTSYALLFLARGRHPIIMNKLRFDGYWSNRPRDLANIARFAGRQLERPLNWQVVNVDNPWTDWTDSPILFIASHEAPKLTDEHIEKLRKFVDAGGMIFTHADAGSPAFDKWARELAQKLFKNYEMQAIPDNHPLWTTVFKISNRPPLFGVSNGSRLLMLHSPTDIALKWQQRADRAYEGKVNVAAEVKNQHLANFYLGVNLFVYAAGKRDLRNRLDSSWIETAAGAPIDTVRIGRIRHDGNWDPEPGAWKRYANWFFRETGTMLEIEVLKASDLRADTAKMIPFVHLTGTARAGMSDADAKGLRDYVQGGGVVLIDSTGGLNAFDTDMRGKLLPMAFPDDFPHLIDTTSPLLVGAAPGMADVTRARVRPYVIERMGTGLGTLQMLGTKPGPTGRHGAVILSSLDLTSGLLGTNTWGVLGFDPGYSQALVKNVIFWTLDGARN